MLKFLNKNSFSVKKLLNRSKVISEYANQKAKLISFPNMIHIEPTNHCNLGCVMCPQPRDMQRIKGMMSMDLFIKIIDELKTSPAEFVYLHQFGESLLHKKIYEMIDYASNSGIQTGMSTNATILNEENSKKILNSKLNFLTLSLDGASEETYDKIRPGVGNYTKIAGWKNVEKNVFDFLNLRRKIKNNVHVVAQTISMKGNENAINQLKQKFKGYDISFSNKPYNEWGGKVEEINKLSTNELPTDPERILCEKPWRLLTITWDGTVVPCTRYFDNQDSYGKFPEQTLKEIWNSERAIQYRQLHISGRKNVNYCSTCSLDGPTAVERQAFRLFDVMFLEKFMYDDNTFFRHRKFGTLIEKIFNRKAKKLQ
jgi:hypothetical protein